MNLKLFERKMVSGSCWAFISKDDDYYKVIEYKKKYGLVFYI